MNNESPEKNPKTYGIRNVLCSVALSYVVIIAFSTQGIYNWSNKLAVSPFSQDLREWTELLWAGAAELGLEEPRNSLDSWFLGLQDAHPLLYPKSYAQTIELRQKRRLRKMEKVQVEKTNPKLAAKMQKEKQTMDPEEDVIKGKRPRVLIVGDSLMMTVGPVLKETVTSKMFGSAIVRAKLSTGLARPDVFDWNGEIRSFAKKNRFDLIVMMLGTNDSQDFVEKGQIMSYGTTEWVKVYNQRILSVMKSACSGAKKVVWFGLPPMKSKNFDRKAHRINSWAKKQADLSGCVDFVSTDKILGDEQGKFASYLRIGEQLEKVRMVDGIHVTKKGGQMVSNFLLEYFGNGKDAKTADATELAH